MVMVMGMTQQKDKKVNRILFIYSKLIKGNGINKKEEANFFNVNEKSIQRDLDDIRNYFSEHRDHFGEKNVVYRRDKEMYTINNIEGVLTKKDALALSKILLESRAFCKKELLHLIDAVLRQIGAEERKYIKDIIGNELFNYVPRKHSEEILSKIWSLSELIRKREVTKITYIKGNGVEVERKIKPLSIIFSEYYFYLIAYSEKYDSPTIFRVDRIIDYKSLNEKFHIKNAERFEDGEFRKKIQFMYAGALMKIKFEFTGESIDSVLDRLPTAKILEQDDNKFIVEAEVYGKGIIMWILSQGKNIKVLSPTEFVVQIREEIESMQRNYII